MFPDVPWLMPSVVIWRQASTIDCRIAPSSPALIASLRMSASLATPSRPERIGLFLAAADLPRRQRGRGMHAVEPDIEVELLGQTAFGIVAPALCLRTIDHSDEGFESWLHQPVARLLVLDQIARYLLAARNPPAHAWAFRFPGSQPLITGASPTRLCDFARLAAG